MLYQSTIWAWSVIGYLLQVWLRAGPLLGQKTNCMKQIPMITVVDDDASVRKALSRLIKATGYDAVAYESAEAFIAANAVTETDCLILDIHLPGKSGLELQAELVESGTNRPIVFITAFDDERARSQALEAGAVEFLRKPLYNVRVLEAIQTALKSA